MEAIAVLIAIGVVCMVLVVAAWRRGGTRIGLWTLGLVVLALALGSTGAVILFAEAICEDEECPSSAWDVVAFAGAALSLLSAVALTARAGGRAPEA